MPEKAKKTQAEENPLLRDRLERLTYGEKLALLEYLRRLCER